MRRGSGSSRSPIIVSDDEDENVVRIQHEEQFPEAAIATQLQSHSYSKSQETLFRMGYIQEQGLSVEIDGELWLSFTDLGVSIFISSVVR